MKSCHHRSAKGGKRKSCNHRSVKGGKGNERRRGKREHHGRYGGVLVEVTATYACPFLEDGVCQGATDQWTHTEITHWDSGCRGGSGGWSETSRIAGRCCGWDVDGLLGLDLLMPPSTVSLNFRVIRYQLKYSLLNTATISTSSCLNFEGLVT